MTRAFESPTGDGLVPSFESLYLNDLLNGCAEFDLKTIEAPVIIDESVEMAKKFCDEDTYKLINSVLDII